MKKKIVRIAIISFVVITILMMLTIYSLPSLRYFS